MLSENDQIIFDKKKTIADTMIKYFVNIIKNLKFKAIQTGTENLLI